jgi:hypothetical protein
MMRNYGRDWRKRRIAAKWTWDEARAYAGARAVDRGGSGQCPMRTSTDKYCVKAYHHRRGHSTQDADVGKKY